MVTLRWAEPEDVESIARIQVYCFPGLPLADRIERIRNDPRYGLGDILVAEENGRMAGGATLLPQKIWTGGSEHLQGGVAAVQVDPDFRRRGIAQAVMKRLFEAHRERDFPLSMLHPYNPVFYRRLGYAPIERWIELRLRTASLPSCEAAMAVRTATEDDREGIIECHRRSLPGHNGGMGRSRGVWEQRILNVPRPLAIFEREGRVQGYVLYELTPTRDGLQQTLYVREWVALDGEAARALFGYLAMQHAQCPEMRMFAPVDFSLPVLLFEPRSLLYENPGSGRYSSGSVGTGAMARVMDLGKLFAGGRRFAGPPICCCFRLVETAATAGGWNGSVLEEVNVTFENDTARVTPRRPSAWLECDPGTLAQIYFGAVRPGQAARWGAARVDSDETLAKLDTLFAQDAPFLHPLDYF